MVTVRGCEVVAVIPAAGRSRRLAPLPCSKELLPVGLGPMPGADGLRPKVVSHYLMDALQMAGVQKTFLVIRQGKWDIPAYWGDGERIGMSMAYLVIDGSKGPPETIDRAFPFVADKVVAFGFPDIIVRPANVFQQLLKRLARSRADVVLGSFIAHDHRAMDMIEINARSRVVRLELKPKATDLRDAWVCAVWTPVFTKFLHAFLQRTRGRQPKRLFGNRRIDPQGDIPVGAVIREAIRAGVRVEAVRFPVGDYLDVGTPESFALAARSRSN